MMNCVSKNLRGVRILFVLVMALSLLAVVWPHITRGRQLSDQTLVTDLMASSGRAYEVDILQEGSRVYIDRSYTWTMIPSAYAGQSVIRSANDDKSVNDTDFLRFSLQSPATLFVAFDVRATALPGWLADGGWVATGDVIETSDVARDVYRKAFPAGPVVLGGNAAAPMQGARSNFNVIVVPDVPEAPDMPTTGPSLIGDIAVASGELYEVDTLDIGTRLYIDRKSYAFTTIPAQYAGQEFIRTANDDKVAASDDFLRFTLGSAAQVCVAYDVRVTALPAWLDSAAWVRTGDIIETSDTNRQVYCRSFPSGEVTLGGNAVTPMQGARSNYSVIVLPEQAEPYPEPDPDRPDDAYPAPAATAVPSPTGTAEPSIPDPTSTPVPTGTAAPAEPWVTLTSPSDGAVFRTSESIPISADAGAPAGSVTEVAFYINGSFLGRDTSNAYGIEWVEAPVGQYTLTAQVTDSAGQTSTSSPVQIEVIEQTDARDLGDVGTVSRWGKLEIDLIGPDAQGMSDSNNPFKITVDVTFTGPEGQTYVVPAFYDGDGAGGMDGNVWKVRFAPDHAGNWQFRSASSESLLDGYSGSFSVTEAGNCQPYTPGGLPDFACVGRLSYTGERYLQFADGTYFLKGGADEPEDFLAADETVGFGSKEAAIDYLAAHGVNSIYLLLHNVDGDSQNVWPWAGASQSEARRNHEHFDVARLTEWEKLFTYIQSKGIVLHLVLEDDSAWTGFNRDMYYREMVSRFSHHNGLYWNLVEEHDERYSFGEVQSFAALLKAIDPYDHPVTVHNVNEPSSSMIRDSSFDLTSIQTPFEPQNDLVVDWYERATDVGRSFPVSVDETGDIYRGDRDRARRMMWSIYLGGASFEMFTASLQDYRDFADHFDDMTRIRTVVERLPYWEMRPANELLGGDNAYLLAKPGAAYIAYLPRGGSITLDLAGASGSFSATWIDPRNGQEQSAGQVDGARQVRFTTPDDQDWTLVVTNGS